MLIENDKRGDKNKIQLIYSDEMFYIPDNVYIIGMMNTADRSLAMMDYALRRRFGFFELFPAFDSERFKAYQESLDNRKFDSLIAAVEDLNRHIKEDESLGEDFCIGHSYFCNIEPEKLTEQRLSMLVEYEIIPMLKEYWFDEPTRIKAWSDRLRSAKSPTPISNGGLTLTPPGYFPGSAKGGVSQYHFYWQPPLEAILPALTPPSYPSLPDS